MKRYVQRIFAGLNDRRWVSVAIAATVFLVFGATELFARGANEDAVGVDKPALGSRDTESIAEGLRGLGIQTLRDDVDAIEFTLESLSGGEITLSDYRGSLIFLNFWATWCGPCTEEMPSMQVLYDEFAHRGLEIIAVNLQEDRATVAEFISEYPYTYPIALDYRGSVASRYSVRGIPTSYFIAPDGRILGMKLGFRLWDDPEVIEFFDSIVPGS